MSTQPNEKTKKKEKKMSRDIHSKLYENLDQLILSLIDVHIHIARAVNSLN